MLLAAVLLTVGATNVYAQGKDGNNNAKQGQVTLNINLSHIQTLVVNPNDGVVNLNYETKYDYEKGVSTKKENHLTVFSTGLFQVTVKSESGDLKGTGDNKNNTILAADIEILASNGNNNNLDATMSKVNLSGSEQKIIDSSTGGRELNYNVEYSAKGNDEYINKFAKGENPTVYSTTVTYTITAK